MMPLAGQKAGRKEVGERCFRNTVCVIILQSPKASFRHTAMLVEVYVQAYHHNG